MIPVQHEGRTLILDTEGKILLDTPFEHVGAFNEGFASVRKNGKSGIIMV